MVEAAKTVSAPTTTRRSVDLQAGEGTAQTTHSRPRLSCLMLTMAALGGVVGETARGSCSPLNRSTSRMIVNTRDGVSSQYSMRYSCTHAAKKPESFAGAIARRRASAESAMKYPFSVPPNAFRKVPSGLKRLSGNPANSGDLSTKAVRTAPSRRTASWRIPPRNMLVVVPVERSGESCTMRPAVPEYNFGLSRSTAAQKRRSVGGRKFSCRVRCFATTPLLSATMRSARELPHVIRRFPSGTRTTECRLGTWVALS